MSGGRPVLDRFRLLAAALVVCIHTGPLASWSPAADFWLCRVLARIAVPFFFLCSGYFLARSGWRDTGRFLKKTLLLYAAAVALYLPLNLYGGGYGPLEWGRRLVTEGTLYHLWYFPAVITGVLVSRGLARLGTRRALALAGALYLLGLGGDSYYGLVRRLPGAGAFYDGVFRVFSQSRNGLFFAPLFLLLGAAGLRWSRRTSALGAGVSLAAMSAEGFFLRELGWQRHDSMYLFLPLCMVFFFSLLLEQNQGEDRRARRMSMLIYLVHPLCIVLVRGGAKAAGLTPWLVKDSRGHFLAVWALSLAAAWVLDVLRPLRVPPRGRAWREVDLGALEHNARTLRDMLPQGCELMAVLKADAYGHGAVRCARRLRREEVRAFAVACLAEGIALRKGGVGGTILILGYTPPEAVPLLRRWRLTQTVADAAHGHALADMGIPIRVHLALDTGMRRLGIPAEDLEVLESLYRRRELRIGGVFSHLCVSDDLSQETYTKDQLDRFYRAVKRLRQAGHDVGKLHVQASYGLLNLPPQPCGYVRAGIVLYGVSSGEARRQPELRPVLSLRARVACVRTLRPGDRAGYGLDFLAQRETRLAVVTIGYADGLPRELAKRGGRVLLHGVSCPMAGRMCMDQLLVDVTEAPEVRAGDIATLIGRDGRAFIPAEETAERCGTIANELLSRLGTRTVLTFG
ncbi:MAG: serine racemase VanT catalytic subunit [Oscillibacter sp.]|nr:serine racemase VanT catalytic subunit [Oscillibacter sp.]